MPIWASIVIVLVMVCIGALFVAAEIALVSLREGQVRALSEKGRRGERVAGLISSPNRFLGAVQIGVTTTAILVSAFGEATLGHPAGRAMERAGLSKGAAGVVGLGPVVIAISYVPILLGELVPKRLGLQRAEGTALVLGPPLE